MLKVHDKPANAEEQDEDSTLDELAREGARWMLMKALAVEITQYVEEHGAETGRAWPSPRRAQRAGPGTEGDLWGRHPGGAGPSGERQAG